MTTCQYSSTIATATAWTVACLIFSIAQPVSAQHADVDFEVVDGAIVLPETIVFTAQFIGPGFPPLPGPPPVSTDQPGFETLDGSLSPGAAVGLRVIQPLHFWNLAAVANPSPLSTIVRLKAESGAAIDVDRSGVPDANQLDFAVASNEGGLHDHLTFQLPEFTAPDGAYGLVLQLTSPGLADSRPFLAVFGQRISAAQLQTAADAILAASGISDGALQADFNLDAQVSGSDLAAWKSGIGQSSYALLAAGDATRDGRVDGADFLVWQREVGRAAVEPSTHAVPEPAALALAIAGALAGMILFSPRSVTGG